MHRVNRSDALRIWAWFGLEPPPLRELTLLLGELDPQAASASAHPASATAIASRRLCGCRLGSWLLVAACTLSVSRGDGRWSPVVPKEL
jgi:hypothetical protein